MGVVDQEEPMQEPTGAGERIFVSVRVRPLNEKEIARNDVSDWECINENTIIHRNNLSVAERSMYPTAYTFDMVFGPDCSTRQVYEEGAKEVALSGVRGINSSVFAYGQTSSGKTFTMSGITEYTVADMYDYIERHQEREFVMKFSAMEIYNESVRDLLSTDTTPLRLLDDPERGTVVEKLLEETLRDWNHFKELLSLCEAQRQIGETSLNETSSRSHQILRLTIESSAREFLGNDKSSALTATVNFVDLAGSERASQSLSAGMRLKEGCHINRSLLTLGTVIRKLSKGRSGHIPFRDSKLTRILQSSLGGNARTAIICTMSPARIHVEQTRNTLLFASCAKEVTTNAQVNVVMSDKALVKQLQRELARLESELKSGGLHSVGSDSTALLREKDLQIEKLMNEVAELTRQLHLARSQVENALEAAKEGRISTIWTDQRYPKLRVRYSWRTETSSSYSPVSEDPQSIDVGVRSCGASRCSDGQSSSSSDGHSILFPDFEETFVEATPRLDPSIITTDFVGNNRHDNASEEQINENSDDVCKEVQCIEVEEVSRNRYSNSTTLGSNSNRYAKSTLLEFIPNTYVESNTPSPIMRTHESELKEVEKEDKANKETGSTIWKESNNLHPAFVIPFPEKASPWLLDEGMPVSRSLKLKKSRSCRARLMDHLPTFWFEEPENIENTPPIGFDKIFIGRPEDYQRKHFALKYGFDIDSIPKDITQACVGPASVDDPKQQSSETSTDWVDPRVSNSNATAIPTDHLVEETKENSPALFARDVKDIGLDPIQDDVESAPKWPSEFKRLQREVIELWDACNISLVHRTYIYLLFKGDPADSFYMEVELRRLSFLKETFSQRNKAMVDGRIVTANSSKRALIHERRMLSKYMQKRLSGEERDNLFLKWGIALSSSHRRLQLAQRLWTKTTDMDHIIESATLVAKLVGFEEQTQALKEMFGLLNFTPKYRKRSSIWKRSLAFL